MLATPALAQSPKIQDVRTPHAAKVHAKQQLKVFGWTQNQWGCLRELWTNESNWRPNAQNKTPVTVLRNGQRVKVYAGGIPQILGLDPQTPVFKQVHLGMKYIESRYQSPCKALGFWDRNSWY